MPGLAKDLARGFAGNVLLVAAFFAVGGLIFGVLTLIAIISLLTSEDPSASYRGAAASVPAPAGSVRTSASSQDGGLESEASATVSYRLEPSWNRQQACAAVVDVVLGSGRQLGTTEADPSARAQRRAGVADCLDPGRGLEIFLVETTPVHGEVIDATPAPGLDLVYSARP